MIKLLQLTVPNGRSFIPILKKFSIKLRRKFWGYRDESQLLDQCSRLFDSSVSNNGFENDASSITQELGGISVALERQKAILQELMTVVKDMLRNTEGAVHSFTMLHPIFIYQNKATAASASAPSQTLGAMTAQTSSGQPASNNILPVLDFYRGVPKKPSPFLCQTVSRFEKYLSKCRQWIEEFEQLLFLDEKNSSNPSSSLLQFLPKVMANVHDYFVHVAAKVESIHQHTESMKTAYLADKRCRGDGNDPFPEAVDGKQLNRRLPLEGYTQLFTYLQFQIQQLKLLDHLTAQLHLSHQ